jgi:hypothetical protein
LSTYRVVLATRTSFNFKQSFNEYSFDLKVYKVMLRKIISEVDQKISGIKYGFFIEIELETMDINSAISRAYDISELFLSMMSLETGVETYRSTLILAYDITEGISERDFIQFFYDLPLSRPQQADLEIYTTHLEAVLIYNGDQKERLHRSIRWLRKGINEDDPLDQFLALWQGLETLNTLLAAHFNCENAGKETIKQKCVKTGELFYSERTTKQGLEKLVYEVELDKSIWKKINRTRNSISHGYAQLAGLYDDSIRLSPYLAKLLHEGISLILGFEVDEKVVKHLENIAPLKVGETCIVECKLLEKDLNKLGSSYNHPFFISENEVIPFQNGYTVKQKMNPVIGCNYSAGAIAVSGRGVNVELESVE